jgi:hypothetical protein
VSRDLEPSLLVTGAASDARVQPVVEPLRGLAARQCPGRGGAAAATGLLRSEDGLLVTGDPTGTVTLVGTLARADAILDRRPIGDVLP